MSESPTAETFDSWYSNLAASPRHAALVQQALGLPDQLDSSSLLPWDGIAEVTAQLAVGPGDTLVDLGCGRGGYGLEVAARTGATLIGIDFSAVAVDIARRRARSGNERFAVGSLTATGLESGSVDAIMSIDAMQFAEPYSDGLRECLRILVPGGRLVLTGWEPLGEPAEDMPPRLRHDIGACLADAGFLDVVVQDMPAWRAAERALWTAAVAVDPQGDEALESLREEGQSVLPFLASSRRVMAFGRS